MVKMKTVPVLTYMAMNYIVFSKPAITHTQAAIKNTNQQNKRVHRAFLTSMNFLFLSPSFPQKLMKHFKSKTGSTQDRKCL